MHKLKQILAFIATCALHGIVAGALLFFVFYVAMASLGLLASVFS